MIAGKAKESGLIWETRWGFSLAYNAPLVFHGSRVVPIRRMAKELGLSASVVSRRLDKLGIDHPRVVGRPSK